ncbi:MAG: leucine-rich repeat domain-containing protein, partial [Planctomycetales bacterium]
MTEQNAIPVPQPDSPDPDVVRAAGVVKAVKFLWGFKLWIAGLGTFGVAAWAASQWVGVWPLWMLYTLFAAAVLPVVVGLFELQSRWVRRRRQRRLEDYRLEHTVAEPGRFRLSPWQDTPDDRKRFKRPDGLHKRVTEWIRQSTLPLLYLTGSSGSGKSSLLNAAVLPELRGSSGGKDRVHSVVLRGFDDPMQELRDWLLKDDQPWIDSDFEKERSARTLLAAACERLRAVDLDARLLIVFDQFEELMILHEVDSEQVKQIREFLQDIVAKPQSGLTVLLSLRSDYEQQLKELGLPPRVLHQNWEEVGYLTRSEAEQFLISADPRLKIERELLSGVLNEASTVDGTPEQIRPVVLNMLGLILQRLHPTVPNFGRNGTLLTPFIQSSIEASHVRHVSGLILSEMLQKDSATSRPQTIADLARQTQLDPAEIQGCLNQLGDSDRQLVRPIDGVTAPVPREARRWEISHDFIACLLAPIIKIPQKSLRERLSPFAVPTSLVTALVLLVVHGLFSKATVQSHIREHLCDEHHLELIQNGDRQTWRAVPVKGFRGNFELRPSTVRLLSRHGDVTELDLSNRHRLTTIPELKGLTNLQTLTLRHCGTLTTISELTGLTSLRTLDLGSCYKLATIPELKGLTSLRTLDLTSCWALTTTPELNDLTSLQTLDLSGCMALRTIPELTGLTSIQTLDLTGCDSLRAIPELTGMTSLQRLDLSGCDSLRTIPELT